jgi:hypothetical protein
MSRRYIKTSRTNSKGEITPVITSVVSTGNDMQQKTRAQTYFKTNYIDVIKDSIPKFYIREDAALSGTHVSYINQLINSYCLVLENLNTVFPVSGLADDSYLSGINTPEGFAPQMYKRGTPHSITPDQFQRNVLLPLGKTFEQFSHEEDFVSYLSNTFLPSIPAVTTTDSDLASLTTSAYNSDSSGTYRFLVNNLGWLYFLNRAAPVGGGYSPSGDLATLMGQTLWRGFSLEKEDLMGLFQEYLWRNYEAFGVTDDIIPPDYLSSTLGDTRVNTSGSLLLDKLKLLNKVLYSPHYLDTNDTALEAALETYISTSSISTLPTLITEKVSNGPFYRFLNGISFSIADRVSEANELEVLYDLGRCPVEFLEPLADLIGWRFIGADKAKWRNQLRTAVQIYKSKGTKKSIQTLLDTLFSQDVFNITDDKVSELWESYVPDLIYYSLATSSTLFSSFREYTPQVAQELNVSKYSNTSMDENIRLAVDQILFDLAREFPKNFWLGTEPFSIPHFILGGTQLPYDGPYHIHELGDHYYWTEEEHSDDSLPLELRIDPNFVFNYRGRVFGMPPFEKRQYYTATYLSDNLISKLGEILVCFGVNYDYVVSLIEYLRGINRGLEDADTINSFLLFTKKKEYPVNYGEVLKTVTQDKSPAPIELLSMWSGKSSHFLVVLDSSSFDWKSNALDSDSAYSLNKILGVMDEVIPAHAIPSVILNVSAVTDSTTIQDIPCREVRPNFYDLYTGSGDVTNNYASKAVNMAALATANGITPNQFTRSQVSNVNDVLLSGTTYLTNAKRNSLRRRNFRHLLPETKMFTRGGRNNPGSLELSTSYYSSAIGYIPLGYTPSSLAFETVALRANPYGYEIGELIDYRELSRVWDQCYNINSGESIYGYDVSNTFASRARQNITSSDCNSYGRRGQLPEIISTMNSLHNRTKYLQAYAMVSGYYNTNGTLNPNWPSGDSLITPYDFSAWYGNTNSTNSVARSIGNYLLNQEANDDSIKYYEHFEFGRKINSLYSEYISTYGQHGTFSNYSLLGGPNIFSHTFGPYIYNNDFNVDGSAVDSSAFLQASSYEMETDISYYGGSGVLSVSGGDVGSYIVSDSSSLYVGTSEFRNPYIVSSITLVDSVTDYLYDVHPIFSVFKLRNKNDSNRYKYNDSMIGNGIIKYHRPTSSNSFPRIILSIDNSDTDDKSRNFLTPNHEYEIEVLAHNLDLAAPDKLGGLSLGCWIHTQSENGQSWNFVKDRGDGWQQYTNTSFTKKGSESLVKSLSQSVPFNIGTINQKALEGGGSSPAPFTKCLEEFKEGTIIPGTSPSLLGYLGENTRQSLKFAFSTYNNNVATSNDYFHKVGKVHRTNQKYNLEFFITRGSQTKFVVIEEIRIYDKTRQSECVINTPYGELPANKKEVVAIFRYYNDLRAGIASRNSSITSGTMEVSGGARANYRSNMDMYYTVYNSGENPQLEEIHIEDL